MSVEIKILTEAQLDAVHQATLRLLEETGVAITHPEVREILHGAGALVSEKRVRFPAQMVEDALQKCPSQITLLGRGGKSITHGSGTLHWHNSGGPSQIEDLFTGEHRPSTTRDVQDCARLLDALEGVDSITPFFSPQDVPGALMGLAMYRHTLPGTTKPVSSPGFQTAAEARYLVRMAEVIGDPAQVLALSVSPISPLQLPDDLADAVLQTARLGIAFHPLPAPTAGATAPMSLAGVLVQQNAEVLALVVLAQAVHPGLPVMYCGRQSIMDPRSGVSSWGVAALGLVSAAVVQVAHRYRMPVNVYGLCTDSNLCDFQSGYERAMNALLPALAGADELSGIGNLGTGTFGNYAQMVCDNDLVLEIKRLCRGFDVNPESLAVDLVAQVTGEAGAGNFLAERHTVTTLRSGEVFFPRLAVRRSWEDWSQSGRQDMLQLAQAKAEKLLLEHHPEPLSAAQEKALDEIMAAAARELVG